jgi:hypothetical protein
MTPEDKEWQEYRKKRSIELDEYFKDHHLVDVKTRADSGKYWHLQIERYMFATDFTSPTHDLGLMKMCIECMEHSKTISEEVLKHWTHYWSCFVSDTVGEAHCKVGTQYFPRYGELAVGKEKEEYEEIIKLGCRFWELYPKEEK